MSDNSADRDRGNGEAGDTPDEDIVRSDSDFRWLLGRTEDAARPQPAAGVQRRDGRGLLPESALAAFAHGYYQGGCFSGRFSGQNPQTANVPRAGDTSIRSRPLTATEIGEQARARLQTIQGSFSAAEDAIRLFGATLSEAARVDVGALFAGANRLGNLYANPAQLSYEHIDWAEGCKPAPPPAATKISRINLRRESVLGESAVKGKKLQLRRRTEEARYTQKDIEDAVERVREEFRFRDLAQRNTPLVFGEPPTQLKYNRNMEQEYQRHPVRESDPGSSSVSYSRLRVFCERNLQQNAYEVAVAVTLSRGGVRAHAETASRVPAAQIRQSDVLGPLGAVVPLRNTTLADYQPEDLSVEGYALVLAFAQALDTLLVHLDTVALCSLSSDAEISGPYTLIRVSMVGIMDRLRHAAMLEMGLI